MTRRILSMMGQTSPCHGQKLMTFATILGLNWLLYIRLKKIHFCIISVLAFLALLMTLTIPAGLGLVMPKRKVYGNGLMEAILIMRIGIVVNLTIGGIRIMLT